MLVVCTNDKQVKIDKLLVYIFDLTKQNKMPIIIGFDCAVKNLGVAVVEVIDWRKEINELEKKIQSVCISTITYDTCKNLIEQISVLADNFIQIKYLDVYDVIPDKKMKESKALERASSLKGALNNIDVICKDLKCEPDTILVEFQMAPNNKINDNFSQIVYHYIQSSDSFKCKFTHKVCDGGGSNRLSKKSSVIVVNAGVKNKVRISAQGGHQRFLEKYKSHYTANKAHTIFNFQKFCETFNQISSFEHLINQPKSKQKKKSSTSNKIIKKQNIKDIADAFMMIVGYVMKNKI